VDEATAERREAGNVDRFPSTNEFFGDVSSRARERGSPDFAFAPVFPRVQIAEAGFGFFSSGTASAGYDNSDSEIEALVRRSLGEGGWAEQALVCARADIGFGSDGVAFLW
tara:strand:+ start:13778 stop:14110 length:333 start_codon:yes stop_codon:yes gene_type:complete